jgi:hypothetical protein
MKSRRVGLLLLTGAASLLGACLETSRPTPSGEGNIRGLHAMSTAPDVNFLIEERSLGSIAYKATTSAEAFDDFTYNFRFETRLPGDAGVRRIAARSLAVVPDTDYVFVLTGTLGAPSILLWESPERQWAGTETVLEVAVGHVAASVGEVDVFLAPLGTAPAVGQERGSLAFGERLPNFDVEDGDYVLTITAAGDPANVLFRSGTQGLNERTSILYTIQDADPSITSGISVRRVDQAGTSVEISDPRLPPTRRFFHAALGVTNLDVVVDEDFAAPVVANLAFGTLSTDAPVPSGASTFSFTQAGNPGAVLLEDEDTVSANTRSTAFLTGPPGDLDIVSFSDDRRSIAGLAKLRITQVSTNFEDADLYLVTAGTDIADVNPNFPSIDSRVSTGYLQLEAGSYELTVTVTGEKTVAAGPLALELANGDVVELAIVDTADPNLLDLVVYDP